MTDIWIISDTHFSHANICKFMREDETPLRPWDSIHEMDEALINNWNSVVKEWDKIYHLGDFSMGFKELPGNAVGRLNGRKRLVRGNHDMCPTAEYMKYFEEIYGVRVFHKEGLIFSHYPIQEKSIKRNWLNVHGHLHERHVTIPNKANMTPLGDARYFNASVECINYTPIHIDELIAIRNKLDR